MSSWQPKAHHAKQSQMLLCSQWCSCRLLCVCDQSEVLPSPPLDNIRVMVIVWRLGGNIIRTTLCWIDDQLISFSALTLLVWSSIGHLACKNRPRNDLLCVKWDFEPYTVHTHWGSRSAEPFSCWLWISLALLIINSLDMAVIWSNVILWTDITERPY